MYTLYLKQIREIMAQSASIATLNGVIEVRDVRIKALEKQLASAKALSQRLYGNFHRDSNYG